MKSRALAGSVLALIFATSAYAAEFYPIASVETNTVNFFEKDNLIEGPGVGFEAEEPHNQLGTNTWVTDAPGGFPADYIEVAGPPVITLDLGEDQALGEISVWGYADTNANGVSQFSLRFATQADGIENFGGSAGPFAVEIPATPRQSFTFPLTVARYVEFTALDNHFVAPGDGSTPGSLAGGDRTGLGEIAFEVIPEPAGMLLLLPGLILLGLRRR